MCAKLTVMMCKFVMSTAEELVTIEEDALLNSIFVAAKPNQNNINYANSLFIEPKFACHTLT